MCFFRVPAAYNNRRNDACKFPILMIRVPTQRNFICDTTQLNSNIPQKGAPMTRQRTKEQLASKLICTDTMMWSSFINLPKNNFARFFGLALLLNGLLACTSTTEKGIGNASEQTQAIQGTIEDIDVATFAALMEQDSVIILDVRTLAEVNAGAIQGAIHLDFYHPDFQDKLSLLDKSSTYLVYCRSGNRSSQASALMTERLGFKDVKNLLGGYQAWAKQ